jgi:hypothetical protein
MGERTRKLEGDKSALSDELKALSDHLRKFTRGILLSEGMPPPVTLLSPLRTPPKKEKEEIKQTFV